MALQLSKTSVWEHPAAIQKEIVTTLHHRHLKCTYNSVVICMKIKTQTSKPLTLKWGDLTFCHGPHKGRNNFRLFLLLSYSEGPSLPCKETLLCWGDRCLLMITNGGNKWWERWLPEWSLNMCYVRWHLWDSLDPSKSCVREYLLE